MKNIASSNVKKITNLVESSIYLPCEFFSSNGQPIREIIIREAVSVCENYATDCLILLHEECGSLRELLNSRNAFIDIYFRQFEIDWKLNESITDPEELKKYRSHFHLVKYKEKLTLKRIEYEPAIDNLEISDKRTNNQKVFSTKRNKAVFIGSLILNEQDTDLFLLYNTKTPWLSTLVFTFSNNRTKNWLFHVWELLRKDQIERYPIFPKLFDILQESDIFTSEEIEKFLEMKNY